MLLATMAIPTAAHNFDAEGVVAIFAVLGWLGAIVLGYVLRSKYAACQGSALFLFALRILGPAVGTAWLGSAAVQLIDPMFASRTLELMFKISAATSVASLSYWLTAIVVRIPEALEIRRYIRWQSAQL